MENFILQIQFLTVSVLEYLWAMPVLMAGVITFFIILIDRNEVIKSFSKLITILMGLFIIGYSLFYYFEMSLYANFNPPNALLLFAVAGAVLTIYAFTKRKSVSK